MLTACMQCANGMHAVYVRHACLHEVCLKGVSGVRVCRVYTRCVSKVCIVCMCASAQVWHACKLNCNQYFASADINYEGVVVKELIHLKAGGSISADDNFTKRQKMCTNLMGGGSIPG